MTQLKAFNPNRHLTESFWLGQDQIDRLELTPRDWATIENGGTVSFGPLSVWCPKARREAQKRATA